MRHGVGIDSRDLIIHLVLELTHGSMTGERERVREDGENALQGSSGLLHQSN
jgi:hypothetical protein